jgi:hypothetical protein
MIQRAYKILKHTAWLLTKGLVTKTVLVSGHLRTGETVLNCMFVAPSLFTEGVLHKLYAQQPTVLAERRVFTPLLRSFLRKSEPGYDVCITSLAKGYSFIVRPIATYVGQSLVNQKIDTSNGWEGVRQRLSRTNRKKTINFESKFGLNCEISQDPKDLGQFYHQMFLPHVRVRFGKFAVVDSFQEMRGLFSRGSFLMFVTRGGQRIAGALCRVENQRLTYYRGGVVNGDEDMLECGAMTAVYYYLLDYAIKNALQELDALGSKPFLNDGVYRYKASWGAFAEPYEDQYVRTIHYICSGKSHQVASFFHALPTVIINNGSLQMIVGHLQESLPTDAEVSAAIDLFYTSGIKSAEIIAAGGARKCLQLPQ